VKADNKAAAEKEIASSAAKAEQLGNLAAAAVKQADKAAAVAVMTIGDDWQVIAADEVAVAVEAEQVARDEEADQLAVQLVKAAIGLALASARSNAGGNAGGNAAAPGAGKSSGAEALKADWPFLVVTERVWKNVVVGHESMDAAAKYAGRLWSCWILYEKTAAGTYEEVSSGGASAPMTFGLVHAKIRKWVAAQKADVTKVARRASIAGASP